MNLSDLQAFVLVAEHGTLTAAARLIGVPKSTVSRRVSRLEDALAVPLLRRSGRSVSLTDDGQRLFARSVPALRELSAVERDVAESRGEPAGRLRITSPPDLGHAAFFAKAMARYRTRWPAVSIEVVLTNRVVDLVEEGFDLAIRPNAERLGDGTMMGRRVSAIAPRLYASREYVAGRGAPRTPAELVDHSCVTHPAMPAEGWPLRRYEGDELGDPEFFPLGQPLIIDDFAVIEKLVFAGAGIGTTMGTPEASLLEEGAVVPVLEDWRFPAASLWLVWPATRHLSPRLRAFVDIAAEEVARDARHDSAT